MRLVSNTVLITGGASGIGLALAERFLQAGNEVIICSRRAERLAQVKAQYPEIHIRVCDLADEAARTALCQWVIDQFPRLNLLVNNAGIQHRIQLLERGNWPEQRQEIAINIEAPIHLSTLLIPQLLKQTQPAILNVTSGLAFSPLANVPIYSATKAAMRSFTLSLRYQLAETAIEVIEIIPPAVDTDLGGPGLHTFGVPLDQYTDAVWDGLQAGKLEIAYGFSEKASRASRAELDEIFKIMNPGKNA